GVSLSLFHLLTHEVASSGVTKLLETDLHRVCRFHVRSEYDVDKPASDQTPRDEYVDLSESFETGRRYDGAYRAVCPSDCGGRPRQRAESADAGAESDQKDDVTIGPKINLLRLEGIGCRI